MEKVKYIEKKEWQRRQRLPSGMLVPADHLVHSLQVPQGKHLSAAHRHRKVASRDMAGCTPSSLQIVPTLTSHLSGNKPSCM